MKKIHFSYHTKAFTILEVVIVLAIASLITVLVLLGVRSAQRNQRDKAMQDAAGRLLTELKNWEFDRGSNVALTNLDPSYITQANLPGSVTAATLAPINATTKADASTMIYGGGTCASNGGVAVGATESSQQFAVSYWSESAAGPVCIYN